LTKTAINCVHTQVIWEIQCLINGHCQISNDCSDHGSQNWPTSQKFSSFQNSGIRHRKWTINQIFHPQLTLALASLSASASAAMARWRDRGNFTSFLNQTWYNVKSKCCGWDKLLEP
jgi:hypothetical protein